jgi:hypothetical protein
MPAAKSQPPARSLDGDPAEPTSPFAPQRSTYPLDLERVQSGGLDDDPTESGDPVKNRVSSKNLEGGR